MSAADFKSRMRRSQTAATIQSSPILIILFRRLKSATTIIFVNQLVTIRDISNADFFSAHAAPGKIGLVGGTTFIDRAIRLAERRVCDGASSYWSHAFIFG